MIKYLQTVFGESVSAKKVSFPKGTPSYLIDGYTPQRIELNHNAAIVLTPKGSTPPLPTLKKQYAKIKLLFGFPCAVCLDHMTSLQRKNLIESGIPFVCPGTQVFFPFWGSVFCEKFPVQYAGEHFAPATQLVFLYLYGTDTNASPTLSELATKTELSPATCSRAMRELTAAGLFRIRTDGTAKYLEPLFGRGERLQKAFPLMRSPVERTIYVRSLPDFAIFQSGLLQLSEITMFGANSTDPGFAIYRRDIKKLPKDILISKETFLDFGGYAVESWLYDPKILSCNNRVDDLSLLLSLQDERDERIQLCLDEIRTRYGLLTNKEDNKQ